MCIYIVLLSLLPIQTLALDSDKERIDHINMRIDNEPFVMTEPAYMYDGRLFFPVRTIVEGIGGTISWKPEDQQILITTITGDSLLFTIGISEVQFNDRKYVMDVPSFMLEDRVYLPLRHVAEFLHADVAWDEPTLTASLTKIPLLSVEEGDTLASISTELDTTESLLLERNANVQSELQSGDTLKVLIPTIMEHKLVAQPIVNTPSAPPPAPVVNIETNPDFILLSKIIQVEAGNESYESQVAVGSVIMNRVKDDRFPDTIKGVIYHKGQFPPAHNGLLDKSKPNASVIKATKAVWNGENNVIGALYFYNPKYSKSSTWSKRTLVKEIGNHRYVK